MLDTLFRIHQFQLLCDHQALACTPKGPPRRVSVKEMSFGNISGHIYSVINQTVSKPTLVTPTRFAEILLLYVAWFA